MIKVGNLGGVLYYKDVPLLEFKFERGILVKSNLLTDKMNLLPFELWKEINGWNLTKFFDERITPSTRQGIDKFLAGTVVKYYHPERMIRYGSGRCIHDHYWVECDDDDTCWQ